LGKDVLLLTGFAGREAISQLFSFNLDLLAENREQVKYDQLLGQPVTLRIELPNDGERFISGICSRVSQGGQEGDKQSLTTFTTYRMEIVPQLWLLTRRAQSRIFQHLSVPDILKKVFEGLNVSYQISGSFQPRDYCVQYRETDFNFASRLMEEEGIYYFFKHTAEGHTMVVANTPQGHPVLSHASQIIFEGIVGGVRDDDRIFTWEKTQELRSGKYTLWDHCFELPHKHLDATEPIQASIPVGEITHKLRVGNNDKLEIYDYPGAYAQRFDGIAKGGGEQPAELQKIFEDNKRTTQIRIQQEALAGFVISGSSNCKQLNSGYKFTLDRHFDADGEYVLTEVFHSARYREYRSGGDGEFSYDNRFSCIPIGLPFRPLQVTPKPRVFGTQTAIVVGLAGEEIFVDKYGRVKVQFHWDREGQMDENSSCWIRVSQNHSGLKWGAGYWPRIGQEVVVDFVEGDPDQPIILGSVYNASEMPAYKLPDEKTKTIIHKSNSSKGGGGFNEIRFEDKSGSEQIFLHGQRNQDIRIKNDQMEWIGNDTHLIVKKDQLEQVEGDKHQKVKGDHNQQVDGTVSLKVGQDIQEKVGMKYALEAGMEIHLKSGTNLVIESGATLTLKVGGNFININPAGIFVQGTMVMINSGGAAGSGSGSSPEAPGQPKEADNAQTGQVSQPPPPPPAREPVTFSPAALALKQAAQQGAPFCEVCERYARGQA
jgi:type VI secretion system secreted protein VgrG